jgi:predicted transcriptional regulator
MARSIAAYLESEFDIVEGIKRGLDDVAARRLVPHDEAMRRIRATIAHVASTAPNKDPSS